MKYRKLNIDPELIDPMRIEIRRNAIHCETTGDGHLMAPITEEEEERFLWNAKRRAMGKVDEHLRLEKLKVIPGHERDVVNELAKCGYDGRYPFEVHGDGSVFALLDQTEEDYLMGRGFIEDLYAYEWDETTWEDDDRERDHFTTSGSMWPYVEKVFRRDGVSFNVISTDDEFDLVDASCNIPWRKWVEAITDALCEWQKSVKGDDTPVYSFRTLTDPEKLEKLRKINGTDEYDVLWCDRIKWARVNDEEFTPDPDEFKDLDKRDSDRAMRGPDEWDLGDDIEGHVEAVRLIEENRRAWEEDPTIYFGDIIDEYEEELGDFAVKMRELDIDPELVEFAKLVLDRDGEYYEPCRDGGVAAALAPWEEEVLIEDAMCEKQRLETDPEHPVYSFRTINDPEKLTRLQRLFYGVDAKEKDMPYYVLRKDEEEHTRTMDRAARDRYKRLSFGKLVEYKEPVPKTPAKDEWKLVKDPDGEVVSFPK